MGCLSLFVVMSVRLLAAWFDFSVTQASIEHRQLGRVLAAGRPCETPVCDVRQAARLPREHHAVDVGSVARSVDREGGGREGNEARTTTNQSGARWQGGDTNCDRRDRPGLRDSSGG